MSSPATKCQRILVTGPPGVGKTTLIRRVYDELQKSGITVLGFYTEEVRGDSGERIGFNAVSFADGSHAPMARTGAPSSQADVRRWPTVGKYHVDTAAFEAVAIRSLSAADTSPRGKTVLIVDEIGKMELFSKPFVTLVRRLFGTSGVAGTAHPILASVPVARGVGIALVEELKSSPNVQLVTMSRENRLRMASDVAQQLKAVLALH